jgi:hypothetical protein
MRQVSQEQEPLRSVSAMLAVRPGKNRLFEYKRRDAYSSNEKAKDAGIITRDVSG